MKVPTIVIKGAGEMATGIACRLYMANITNIVMLEIPQPLAVRRTVAFCESIYQKEVDVEGHKGHPRRGPEGTFPTLGRKTDRGYGRS
jgi:hypothetical protein